MLTYAAFAASIALPVLAAGPSPASRPALSFRLKAVGLGLIVLAVLAILSFVGWQWMAGPAWAQIATAWGLPGVWQQNCEAPVGQDNPRYKYSIDKGKILLQRDFGRGAVDASEITDVQLTSTGELDYVVHFAQLGKSRKDQLDRRNVLAKSPTGQIRAIANREIASGVESVAGGIRASDQTPTPWMSRCRPE